MIKMNIRRLILMIGLMILMCLFIHIIQTVIFLIEHFVECQDTNDRIKLDMNKWQQNSLSNKKIPRYIHQIWISSIEKKEMSKGFQQAADSCIKYHSNYNYTLWTHENILHWLKIEYSWFLPIYKTYRYDMQRIDAMKYFLLFHFGGIYIDLDIKCHVEDIITAMIPKNQTDYEPDIIFHMGGEGISANTDIMAAKQAHPFFKLAINRLQSANRWFYLYHLTIILSAGPTFLYGIYRKYPFKENIYFVSNDLLWKKLLSGIGGETWYGNDTIILIFFMNHKILLCFLVILTSIILFKFLKRK